ncbi:hypothetical protein [Kitasatospora sp. NPDC059827]
MICWLGDPGALVEYEVERFARPLAAPGPQAPGRRAPPTPRHSSSDTD